jgi:phosphohistidine phosphatase SixA
MPRRLSGQGRREAQEAAEAIRKRGARPAIVFTSPRLRARETAEIVAKALGVSVEVREGLNCGATTAGYLDALRPDEARDVLLVAHNPEISAIAGAAVSASRSAPLRLLRRSIRGIPHLDWIRHPESSRSRSARNTPIPLLRSFASNSSRV